MEDESREGIDYRSYDVVLAPPSAAVGQEVKAVVRPLGLAASVHADAQLDRVRLGRVEWQGYVPSINKWLPLPPMGRTFPWDPHTLVPTADCVSLRVRAAAVLMDIEEDRPVMEYEACDGDLARRRARPHVYFSPETTVVIPPKIAAVVAQASRRGQFGLHCSTHQGRRIALLFCKPAVASVVHVEARHIPDDDSEPLQCVWKGAVFCASPPCSSVIQQGNFCELSTGDRTSLTIHVDKRIDDVATSPSAAEEAAYPGTSLTVSLRSTEDREMAALCVRALLNAAVEHL